MPHRPTQVWPDSGTKRQPAVPCPMAGCEGDDNILVLSSGQKVQPDKVLDPGLYMIFKGSTVSIVSRMSTYMEDI